jgi:hypothetical protein
LVHEVLVRGAQAVDRGGARYASQVLDRGAKADACGAAQVFDRGAQANARGGAQELSCTVGLPIRKSPIFMIKHLRPEM